VAEEGKMQAGKMQAGKMQPGHLRPYPAGACKQEQSVGRAGCTEVRAAGWMEVRAGRLRVTIR
jgi:hypothetical protein